MRAITRYRLPMYGSTRFFFLEAIRRIRLKAPTKIGPMPSGKSVASLRPANYVQGHPTRVTEAMAQARPGGHLARG